MGELTDADRDTGQTLPLRGPVEVPEFQDAPPGYELLGPLGRGGAGIVYRARQLALNRVVALKLLRGEVAYDREYLHRFQIEAEAVAKLKHPGIVQLHAVGQWRSTPYLAMELVEGGTLARKLHAGPLAPREAARHVEQVARAIQHAHACGIIHRDLKPGNILLAGGRDAADGIGSGADGSPSHDWGVKVADFGLAKHFHEAGTTETGRLMGTPAYMAPEQVNGSLQGPPTDVYALGAVLYECLTGRPPFAGDTPIETFERVRHDEPERPGRLRPGIPRDLETICLKCLEKDPARRYPTAAALAEDLRRFMAGEPITARPVGLAERTWKFVRRRPAVAGLAVVSLFAAAGLLGGGVYHAITLQRALDAEVRAKNEAAASAQKARERFDLALDAYSQLVTQVRRMNAYPALRGEQKKALSLVTGGLRRIGDVYATFEPNLQRASAESLLGRFYLDLGQPGEAARHTAEAVRIASRIAQEKPDDYRTRSVEASSLNNHISVFLNTNEIDKAAPFAVQIEEAAEAVLRTAGPDDRPQSIYARCAAQAAQVHLWRRDLASAGPLVERLVDRVRAWAALEPDDVDRLYLLSLALDRAGALHSIRGDEAAALAALEEALPITRKLAAAEPDNPQIQRSVMVHAGNLGEVALEKRQLAKAHAYAGEAFEIARKLVAADPENVNFQDDLVMTQAQLAAANLARLDPAAARDGFVAAEAILEARDARGNKSGNVYIAKELRPKILNGMRFGQAIVASLDQPNELSDLPQPLRTDALAQRAAAFLRQNRREQALRALAEFAAERLTDDSTRWAAAERWCILAGIAEHDPQVRDDCLRAAWRALEAIEALPKRADVEASPVLTPLKNDPKWQNLLDRTR